MLVDNKQFLCFRSHDVNSSEKKTSPKKLNKNDFLILKKIVYFLTS